MKETMSDTKKKILIGVIAGIVVAAIVIVIVIATGGKDPDAGNTDPVNNEGVTATVTPDITDTEPTATVTPEITDEPSNPVITEPVNTEPAKATLGEYKGIKAVYSPNEITEDDINAEIEKLQKENSYFKYLPDRAFKEGDMAVVSINAFVEDKYLEEDSVKYIQVILGEEDLPDFMDEAIYGQKIGVFVQVYHDYPEDFEDPDMAGKTVLYDIELVDGFEYYVPEITDAFIKENTGYASLAEYKAETKEKLQKDENERAHDETVDSIKHTLVDICSYSGNVDYEIKKVYASKISANNEMAKEYGFSDGAEYYAYVEGMSAAEYQSMLQDESTFEAKYQLALDEIIEVEKLVETYPDYSKTELRNAAEQLVIDSANIDGDFN